MFLVCSIKYLLLSLALGLLCIVVYLDLSFLGNFSFFLYKKIPFCFPVIVCVWSMLWPGACHSPLTSTISYLLHLTLVPSAFFVQVVLVLLGTYSYSERFASGFNISASSTQTLSISIRCTELFPNFFLVTTFWFMILTCLVSDGYLCTLFHC